MPKRRRQRRRWPYVEPVRKDGWRASVKVDGRRVKGRTRKGPEAQRQAHDDARTMLRRREVADDPASHIRLADAFEIIETDCERRERRPDTIKFYRHHLNSLIDYFGLELRIAEIGYDELQEFVDARRGTVSGQTIRHDLRALTRIRRLLRLKGDDPCRDPRLVLPMVKRRDPAKRLTWGDLMPALHKLADLGETIDLSVLGFVAGTGIRRMELARMRKIDVDLRGKRIVVPVGKTTPRELPMPETPGAKIVMKDLLELEETDGEHLFPGDSERRRTEWLSERVRRARASTGEKRLALHELRRCFASRLAERHTVPVVSALLGHALPGVTGLYVHADRKALVAAMDDLWQDFEVDVD